MTPARSRTYVDAVALGEVNGPPLELGRDLPPFQGRRVEGLRLVMLLRRLVRHHWHDELKGVGRVEGRGSVRAAFPELDEWNVGTDSL